MVFQTCIDFRRNITEIYINFEELMYSKYNFVYVYYIYNIKFISKNLYVDINF